MFCDINGIVGFGTISFGIEFVQMTKVMLLLKSQGQKLAETVVLPSSGYCLV